MPASTLASRRPRWRTFRTNDTRSGVLAGVAPNALAVVSAAAAMPWATATFAAGWLAPSAGPDATSSSRDPTAPTDSSALARCCLAQTRGFTADPPRAFGHDDSPGTRGTAGCGPGAVADPAERPPRASGGY